MKQFNPFVGLYVDTSYKQMIGYRRGQSRVGSKLIYTVKMKVNVQA